jgi:hypothetical protein
MCLFNCHLTPSPALNRIGATGSFRFKKKGANMQCKKKGAKHAIRGRNEGSFAIAPLEKKD